MSINSNLIAVSATLASPENTFYSATAPTTSSGYTAGDVWYVTPLGTEADAANATEMWRFDGAQWVLSPSGGATPSVTFGTTAPTGTPPAGSEYFLTSDGTSTGTISQEWIYTGTDWVKRPSTSTETPPSLPVAVAIGTQAQLDSLIDKVADGYYIVTDGANKGDIMKWADTDDDGIGDTWELHIVPTNQLEWNVLTNATSEPAGRYTYDILTDTWTKTEEIDPLVPSVDDPTAVGGIKMISRYLAPMSESGSAFILGDSVAGQGRSQSHTIDNGSIVAPAANIPMVQKSPFTYYQTDTPYSTLSQRDAWAVDFQFNNAGAVAIDDIGILYYKGTAAFVTAMTGTDSGVSTVITSAFVPDKFWANRAVKVLKFWLSYNTNNLIALAGDGTIWVKGVAGASGIYGDGTIVVNKLWHQVNIPQKSYRKIYITYDGLACGALAGDGKMYVWGANTTRRIAPIATTPITTPYEITSPTAVTDFAMDANSTMLVSAGARWAIGTNTSGKFGNGNTTALTAYTLLPQNGFTFDKVFSLDDAVNNAYYYITTDKKAVHTGYNDLKFATSVAAANVLTPTLMGNGTYQGTVIDVRAYAQSVLIHTNQGEVWTAVNQGGSNSGEHGWGINIVTGTAGLNTFKKVPVPSLVVGVQSSQSSNAQCQYTVLTDRGLIYTWGVAVFQYGVAEIGYGPAEIPTQMFRQQNPKNNTVVDLLSLTASLTTIANGTASAINDGTNNQTVTFNIPYTGSAGVLDTSAWSITGGDVTVSNIQNPIYVIANSGTLTFTAVVNAADIPTLNIPDTQPQTYTLNTGALTATATGTRGTDAIAGGLTTSISAYTSAANGTWVAITEAEYTAIQTSVGGVFKAGQVDSQSLYTTANDWGELGIGFSATTTPAAETANVTKAIPAGSWLYAYQFKTGSASVNRTNYLSLGTKGGTTGFATVLPAITGVTNTVLQLKQYVYKGGLFVPTTKDIATLGGSTGYASIANHQTYYSASGAPSTTTINTSWGTSAQFMQVLTTPTKQW
jgi:alpha-tubulin suppressor-like RCC1 family protein